MTKYNEKGEELMDDKPAAIPIGFRHPPSLDERIRAMVRSSQMAAYAESQGKESFEDADDFDVGDDLDLSTPYERDHDIAAVDAINKGVVDSPYDSEKVRAARKVLDDYKASGKVPQRQMVEELPTPRKASKEPSEPSPKAKEGGFLRSRRVRIIEDDLDD